MTLDPRWTARTKNQYKPPACYTLDLGDADEAEVGYLNGTYHWYVWVGDTGDSYINAAKGGTACNFLEGQAKAEAAMAGLGLLTVAGKENT